MTSADRGVRLLLVDDEKDFLASVVPGLERRGLEVAAAENGRAALDLLQSRAFDVVVLDVKMPGIDGVETFHEMKRAAPRLPVILLTGHANIGQAFETSRDGVYDYLTKPCDVDWLARAVRRAAEGMQAARESERAEAVDRTLSRQPE